jgi:hypothetical protein
MKKTVKEKAMKRKDDGGKEGRKEGRETGGGGQRIR